MSSENEAESFRLREWLRSGTKVIGGYCLMTAGIGVALEPLINIVLNEDVGSSPAARVLAGTVTAVVGARIAESGFAD